MDTMEQENDNRELGRKRRYAQRRPRKVECLFNSAISSKALLVFLTPSERFFRGKSFRPYIFTIMRTSRCRR